VSREGKAGPLEAGRGKNSPPANPERVISEAFAGKGQGGLDGFSKLSLQILVQGGIFCYKCIE
ncbi:MAG: hypothetical protein ACE5I8_01835, partial [Thermodesulfobacteriota bacterium]